MKLFVFLAAVCTFASTALADPASVQAQLDEMREIIEAQALRIEELEVRSQRRLQKKPAAKPGAKPAAKPGTKPAAKPGSGYDSFKGVRVKSDNAVLTLGKASDVAFVRTGAKQAKFVGDITFGNLMSGDLSAANAKLKKDLNAAGRVTAGEVNIKGGLRVTDDLVLAGPSHKDSGTIGYTYAAGVLKPGESSPAGYVNPNSWSGNGKISVTICSMHTEGVLKTGKPSDGTVGSHHVYKAYWNAHGQGYNDYGPILLQRLKDGGLVVEDNRDIKKFGSPGKSATGFHASGCVFRNKDKKQTAYWVIKQLPLTTFTSTRHASLKTGPWAIK